MTTFLGVFIILHGLAHLWYVALSLQWVAFRPEMGWSGDSWLLTGRLGDGVVRTIASLLYALACLGFVAAGAGLLMGLPWVRPAMIGSAALSLLAIAMFWDGSPSRMVEKGLVGFAISGLVLTAFLALNWAPSLS